MEKNKYEKPTFEVISFENDVITSSGNQCIEDHMNQSDVPPCSWITGYQDVIF